MKKKMISVVLSLVLTAALLAGCAGKEQADATAQPEQTQEVEEVAPEEPATETEEETEPEETAEEPEEAEESEPEEPTEELPAYEYPGPELFYSVLYEYLIDELSQGYPEAQVCIPCPIIVAEDDSDDSDMRLYGNFLIYNYDLNGEILECESGGSYPGCIHIKNTETGYEVTSMEVVEDGAGWDESAKKIFGKHYDALIKDGENEDLIAETRAQIIANYVAANDLNITAYQDYGWDPVPLPEENIDNFYSELL